MKSCVLRGASLATSIFLLFTSVLSAAQADKAPSTPVYHPDLKVLRMDVPFYPPLARQARIGGTVRIRATTDGQKVISTSVEEGHPLLKAAAEENVRSWQLAPRDPTTFSVIFRYESVQTQECEAPPPPVVTLHLPQEVDLAAGPFPICDPSADITQRHWWQKLWFHHSS